MQVASDDDLRAMLGQKVYIVIPTGKQLGDRFVWSTHSTILEWVVEDDDPCIVEASGHLKFKLSTLCHPINSDDRGAVFTTMAEAQIQQTAIALCGEFVWPETDASENNIASA